MLFYPRALFFSLAIYCFCHMCMYSLQSSWIIQFFRLKCPAARFLCNHVPWYGSNAISPDTNLHKVCVLHSKIHCWFFTITGHQCQSPCQITDWSSSAENFMFVCSIDCNISININCALSIENCTHIDAWCIHIFTLHCTMMPNCKPQKDKNHSKSNKISFYIRWIKYKLH